MDERDWNEIISLVRRMNTTEIIALMDYLDFSYKAQVGIEADIVKVVHEKQITKKR